MEASQSIPQLALTYFLMINPIGNYPAILALIKDASFQRQKQIMFREGIFVLIIALVFQFFGEYFLKFMQIDSPALSLCGGILVFLVAINMIFHTPKLSGSSAVQQEPFIVPIATPLLVGPGTLTIIMLTAANEPNAMKVTSAITIACLGVLGVLMAAPYLQKLLGKRGLQALEQVMGMVLVLMSVEMMLGGLGTYIKSF